MKKLDVPASIQDFGDEITIPAGKQILMQGQEVDRLFLLQKGRCRIYSLLRDGRTVILRIAGEGEWLGELELLNAQPACMSVQAMEECRALAFPMARVRPLLWQDAVFLRQLCLSTIEKENENSIRLICSEALPLETRLAWFVLENAENGVFSLKKTETAASLGASYRQVETLMARFVKRGWLEKNKRRYTILKMAELKSLGEDVRALQNAQG
jgi:CRP/FNR family putative post-exponential-phase nitrogen-starvation transcriptional regulator